MFRHCTQPRRQAARPRRVVPTFDVLEDRLTPDSRLLPVSGKDHLFDDLRHVIYATNNGTIQRYDLTTNQALPAWTIGRSLLGMDITPDGQYLVVAEQDCPGTTGFVYKVNLNSGTVAATMTFPKPSFPNNGAFDVVMVSNTKGFVSYWNDYDQVGVRQIDLAANTLTLRPDWTQAGPNFYFQRSADRSKVLFTPYLAEQAYVYSTLTDVFTSEYVGVSNDNRLSAVSRDGQAFAQQMQDWEMAVFDSQFKGIETKYYYNYWNPQAAPAVQFGVAFDPLLDRAYVGNSEFDAVSVYDASWREVCRLPVGTTFNNLDPHGAFLGGDDERERRRPLLAHVHERPATHRPAAVDRPDGRLHRHGRAAAAEAGC